MTVYAYKYSAAVLSKRNAFLALLLLLFSSAYLSANDDVAILKSQLADSRDIARAEIAADIARMLRQADADQALDYANIALEQLALTPHEPTRINVLNTLAIAHLQKRDFERVTDFAQQALSASRALNAVLEEARAQNTLGALNWYQGDLDEAKRLFEASFTLRENAGADDELSPALNNLGVIEEIQGNYNTAIEFYLRAIDYAERIDNSEQLSRPITNLGILHQMLENYDKALTFYERSLSLKLEIGSQVGAALALNNISEIQLKKADYQAALASLEEGLSLLENVDAPQEKALLLLNSGTAHLKLNNPDKAFAYFDQTRELLSQFDSLEMDIYLAENYSRAYLQKGQLAQAMTYATDFLALAEAKKGTDSIKNAHLLRYEIFKQQEQYAEALRAYENFFRIHEELTSQKNTEYVARLQAEFDSERTEKELAMLQTQNALQEVDLKRQAFLRNTIAVSSLLILLVFFFVAKAHKTKIKTELLEQKIEERTQEIQQKNLAISTLLQQKESLLERKNILFSSVSHEFRTPLTLIIGPLRQLAESASGTNVKQTLNKVLKNATRLLRMVDQLLDLAKIDMHAIADKKPVDVNAAVSFLVTNMSPLFEQNKIHYSTSFDSKIWVAISPDALEKIIVNLLSNALKYTPENGRVDVVGKAVKGRAILSFQDSGVGIAKDQQSKIFERFTRLENQMERTTPGAGIGLALVKELVESYQGSIEVQSDGVHGSTFILNFPLLQPADEKQTHSEGSIACENELATLTDSQEDAYQHTDGTKVSPSAVDEKHGTVLMVEDNDEMRDYIGQCINRHYACLYAHDGQAGIDLAIKEIPDLIISDIMMPNVDGLELADALKENQLTSHIPIVLLTAKGDNATRHVAWRKNVDEYIEKPFDEQELLLRCENILSIRQLLAERFALETNTDTATEVKQDVTANALSRECFSQRDQAFLDKLYTYLETHYFESQLNAKTISHALAITDKQLQRKLKALTNDTIPACVRNFRLKKGAEMLANGESITTAAFDAGFSSQSYFSTAFSARYGQSPSEYQINARKDFEETKAQLK